MANIYYNPKKFGLKIVDFIDVGRSYEFDITIIFEKEDGSLWWLSDAGCSCPVPFEDLGVDDLIPYRHDEIVTHLRSLNPDSNMVDFISKLPR
jgi:hypothetical protein